jgi:ABC-type sulfate transport system permease component
MTRNNQIFSIIEPSVNLRNSIIHKIETEERKAVMYNLALSFVVSISITIISFINVMKDASQSGLSEYLSLLFSDGVLIASYWQTYVMSVVESLPIIQISIVVASWCLCIWSINMIFTNFKNTKSHMYKMS